MYIKSELKISVVDNYMFVHVYCVVGRCDCCVSVQARVKRVCSCVYSSVTGAGRLSRKP